MGVLRRIRFYPVYVTGVIVAVALFLGYELDAETVGEGVNSVFEAIAIIGPIVTAIFSSIFTRSKAGLEEQGVPQSVINGDPDYRASGDAGHAGPVSLIVIAVCVVIALLFDWGLFNRLAG